MVSLAAILAVLLLPGFAQAPEARLAVDARHSSGGALAGVVVVLTEQATGLTRQATTSDAGRALLTALPAGIYTLTANLPGFKTEVVREIRLTSGMDATLALVLKPGPFAEQVIVTADAATLRTGSSAVIVSRSNP